ncbi:MAG TPA: hypothetical protein VIF34_07965 [Methylocystis sp.]
MKRQLILASVAAFLFGLSPPIFAQNLSVPPAKPGMTEGQPGGAQSKAGRSATGKKGSYGAAQTDETAGGQAVEEGQAGKKPTTKHKAKHHKRHTH